MENLILYFSPEGPSLDGQAITSLGLQGLFYNLVKRAGKEEFIWLHEHAAPKPFSTAVIYQEDGILVGLRVAVITDRAKSVLATAFESAIQHRSILRLGLQEFRITKMDRMPGPSWQNLFSDRPGTTIKLQFLSPTTFRQGPGSIPLPIPANVFGWVARVWDAYCPDELSLPEGWSGWCKNNIFVSGHDIMTVSVKLSNRSNFVGFVGQVTFEASENHPVNINYWQALGNLAEFSGVGYRTTVGMGVVERLR